jgi:hypothetical protein
MSESGDPGEDGATGARATIRTTHADEQTAREIADAVRPDNTAEVRTRVDGATVATTIERDTASGLRATADDYVVNLRVASGLSADDTITSQ